MNDRGMIPRALSAIFRKSRALEKASEGDTVVSISMSYYEIHIDHVYDLFEPPEKRTPTGLPIREAEGGRTVVAGLSELPCSNLKEFEALYDKANANRSVGATKLNAQSSRSHAILCVKISMSSTAETRSSTFSAIDLAGSEDNRRTGNTKERMPESSSINKSLFVLAQCVEAISKKQARIPYRESKMTRILSLGQNNGMTIMILNLPPTKAFHLDTITSLNFANRTKKIEVREIENEPIFKGPPRPPTAAAVNGGMTRQPLRPLSNASNANILANRETKTEKEKPAKAFSVYADQSRAASRPQPQKSSPLKRGAVDVLTSSRPTKQARPLSGNMGSLLRKGPPETQKITKETLESLVEKKVAEILASREQNVAPQTQQIEKAISAEVQARLDSIEKRLEGQEGERAEGLSYLFMAKQHQARGEDSSALKMYELAQPFFPGNEKLDRKIEKLGAKIAAKRHSKQEAMPRESETHQIAEDSQDASKGQRRKRHDSRHVNSAGEEDESYHAEQEGDFQQAPSDDEYFSPPARKKTSKKLKVRREESPDPLTRVANNPFSSQDIEPSDAFPTPRTSYLLNVLNGRSVSKLKALNGLGTKKAEAIVQYLDDERDDARLESWNDVLGLEVRGIGKRSWESVREGLSI